MQLGARQWSVAEIHGVREEYAIFLELGKMVERDRRPALFFFVDEWLVIGPPSVEENEDLLSDALESYLEEGFGRAAMQEAFEETHRLSGALWVEQSEGKIIRLDVFGREDIWQDMVQEAARELMSQDFPDEESFLEAENDYGTYQQYQEAAEGQMPAPWWMDDVAEPLAEVLDALDRMDRIFRQTEIYWVPRDGGPRKGTMIGRGTDITEQ